MLLAPSLSYQGRRSAAVGGHLYWRLFITNNHGAGFVSIAEVEMRATAGGADQCSGGTATASSTAGGSASNVFDNNASTVWTASSGANEWIRYQFASPVSVTEIQIKLDPSAGTLTRAPKDCILQSSDDGSAWTNELSFTLAAPVIGQTRLFPDPGAAAGYHRCWRIFCVDNNGDASFTTLDEIQFRATAGGANQCGVLSGNDGSSVGNAKATSGDSNQYQAFDGSTTTNWTGSGSTNRWCAYVFPDPVKVEEVSLNGTTAPNRSPNNIKIEYSDDLVTWTMQKSHACGAWTSDETKVIAAI